MSYFKYKSEAALLKKFEAYLDRDSKRMMKAYEFFRAIPKSKRTASDKQRLVELGAQIHNLESHLALLAGWRQLQQIERKKK